MRVVPFGIVLDLRTTTSQKCVAVPRRARIQGSYNCVPLNSRPESNKEEGGRRGTADNVDGVQERRRVRERVERRHAKVDSQNYASFTLDLHQVCTRSEPDLYLMCSNSQSLQNNVGGVPRNMFNAKRWGAAPQRTSMACRSGGGCKSPFLARSLKVQNQ